MRINHSRTDVSVTEQLLNGANVIAVFKEMRGEGVPKRVMAISFLHITESHGWG